MRREVDDRKSGLTAQAGAPSSAGSVMPQPPAKIPAPARHALGLFARCRKGAMAVEFALIGFFAIELVVEVLQAGFYFYTSATIERATSKASRQIMTGIVNKQNLTASQFMTTVLCPPVSEIGLSCSNVISNIQTVNPGASPNGFYTLVNSSKTGLILPPLDNSKTSYCTGISQSYVFVQVLYAMPVFSPIWRVFATTFKGTPSYIVQSTAAFRAEPYPSISQTC